MSAWSMFRMPGLAILAGVWMVISGCVPSLHPIHDASQQQPVAGLEGIWHAAEGDSILFSAGDPVGSYRAVFVDKQDVSYVFNVGATQIGGQMYLDFSPATAALPKSEFLDLHISAWHSFAAVAVDGDTLTLGFADPLWLRGHLSRNPEAIATVEDDRLRLTASTGALREFIAEHAGEMFGVQVQLLRQR